MGCWLNHALHLDSSLWRATLLQQVFWILSQKCRSKLSYIQIKKVFINCCFFQRWKKEYLATSNKVVLAETFSPTFVGLTFQEVAEIVYLRLNLVLIAMEARKYEGGQIWINPKDKEITPNAIGLFITASSDAAKRAWFYCR